MFLDTVNRKIEVLLGEAAATTQPVIVASYADLNQSSLAITAASSQLGSANGATAVSAVNAPGASTTRQVRYLNVFNSDTEAHNVTVRLNDNGTLYILQKSVVQAGQALVFDENSGWALAPNPSNYISQSLDYASGAFTPVLQGSGSNPTCTYTVQSGNYAKIGPLVFFTLLVQTSAISGGSGNIEIGSLPYVAASDSAQEYPAVAAASAYLTWPSGSTQIVGQLLLGTNSLILTANGSGLNSVGIAMSNWPNNGSLYCAGTYLTDTNP